MLPALRHVRRILPSFLIFALVVLTLEAQSIWWDEGISLHLASLPWWEVVADRAANIHPPLYFLLLKAWGTFAGLSPFSGRFLSALAVTLLPACAGRFVGRRVGRRAGRAAGLLSAVAPPFIVYGQEVRAYALLPLGVLALWALVWPASGPTQRLERWWAGRPGLLRSAALSFFQAVLLLTHYAGALACVIAALAYAFRAVQTSRGPSRQQVVREWCWGLAGTIILVLPWALVVMWTGFQGLTSQAGLANAASSPVTAGYVAGLIGMFHTTGLPTALGDASLVRPSIAAGLILSLGVLMGLVRPHQRAPLVRSLLFWLLPFAAAPLIWTLSPQSHPRYLYAYVVGGWLTAAIVISNPNLHKLMRAGSLATLLVASLLGTHAYLTQPRYARSDVRAVASLLRAEAGDGDAVIVPQTDWSLLQYDIGRAKALMAPPFAEWDRAFADLAGQVGTPEHVYVLDYGRDAVDPGGALRVALTRAGVLVGRHAFPGVFVEVYALNGPLRGLLWRSQSPACTAAGTLCLEASAFSAEPVSGAALPVALAWRGQSPDTRYGVALRLYDPSGALIASAADLLVDGALTPTSAWSGARKVTTYHVVPLPVGLLAVPYRLEVGVFDWDDPDRNIAIQTSGGPPSAFVGLGDVVPLVAPWRDVSLYDLGGPPTVVGEDVTTSLRLEASDVDRARARPGEVIFVSTLWRVTAEAMPPTEATVVLSMDGTSLVTVPFRIAETEVPVGRPLLHVVALTVPASTSSGTASVGVTIGGRAVILGEVMVDVGDHVYEAPRATYPATARAADVATLVGFDLIPSVVAGAPCTVTLQWRAGAGAAGADLKVFTHLVVHGEIVAQHDAVPANWSRPTQGWLTDEIIVDAHSLLWQNTRASGLGTVYVGFYRPATGERVIWEDGADRFALPVAISVGPSE